MNHFFVKILLIVVVATTFLNCNSVKKVSEGDFLLKEASIYVNDTLTKNKELYNYLLQKPNQKLAGIPLKLHFYNLGRDAADSIYIEKLNKNSYKKRLIQRILSKKQANRFIARKRDFNEWIKKSGEAPVIIDEKKIKKSQKRLEAYFWNRGWFNVSSSYKIIPVDSLKASVQYKIITKKPYEQSSLIVNIDSKVADSIYKKYNSDTKIDLGEQYNTANLENERNRITRLFRNKGLFHFDKDYIKFNADTLNDNNKINLTLKISDRRVNQLDKTVATPYKVHTISRVNIYTDVTPTNKNKSLQDSVVYKGYNLYSFGKLKFKPKAITNTIFTAPNTIYSDSLRTLTYNSINNLGVFKYPNITFKKDLNYPNQDVLISNIYLTPRKKYAIGLNFDVSTSDIQDVGIGLANTLTIRNLFKRAESFEIAARGSIGSSKDLAESDDRFFNISELGINAKLNFPRILFPFKLDKLIKKSSAPNTSIKVGVSTQQNIGLDKKSVTGVFSYKWSSNKKVINQFDLFNLQFVRNLNAENYFNIYRNSYNRLNNIAVNTFPLDGELFENGRLKINEGTNTFIARVLNGSVPLTQNEQKEVRNLSERRERLTENNLVLSSSYSIVNDTRKNLYDESFYRFRFKVESAGNFLSTIGLIAGREKNSEGNFDLFNVEFSQFIKFETEYIKHWDLGDKNVFAIRGFGGVAFPYGNSNSVPFSQSYFGGGANDNRAWAAYDLGPGSSSGRNEFNEANFKLAFNAEYRFNIISALNGALFGDAGNIWNVLDRFEDEDDVTFSGIRDLSEIALGVGLGLRYDFSFFVLRLDAAYKTYNPANIKNERWLHDFRLKKTVFNIGVNYPF